MSASLKSSTENVSLGRFYGDVRGKHGVSIQITTPRAWSKLGDRDAVENMFDHITLSKAEALSLATDLLNFAQGREEYL